MRGAGALVKLYRVGNARLVRLRLLFSPPYGPVDAARDRTIAHVTVESLNLWSNFVRSYYLACIHNARTSTGPRVTLNTSFGTPQAALDYAVAHIKNWNIAAAPFARRDEPPWHDWSTLVRLCVALHISITPRVQAASGYPTTMHRFLPVFRNFFAHRNDDTFRKTQTAALQLGIPGGRAHPARLLSTPIAGAAQPILAEWLDDIQNLMDLLCN
jgi:hypothetical protein